MTQPTEPKQDRNVEAGEPMQIGPNPCVNCGGEYGEHRETCKRGKAHGREVSDADAAKGIYYPVLQVRYGRDISFVHAIGKLLDEVNSRHSQPVVAPMAGDAVKGVVEDIARLKERWDAAKDNAEFVIAMRAAAEFLFSDRLRLALSATGDDARGGELAAIQAGLKSEFLGGTTGDVVSDFGVFLNHHKEREQRLKVAEKKSQCQLK